MGTRSRIAVMHGDVVKSVYCHWDGYIAYNGEILQKYYDSARANNLVALGDISSLRVNIDIPEGVDHSFNQAQDDITVFYGRDRGETGVEFKVAHTFEDFLDQCENCGAEYYYIMRDGIWYCGTLHERETGLYSKLVVLSEVIESEAVEA